MDYEGLKMSIIVCKSIKHNASIIGRFSEEIASFNYSFAKKLGHVHGDSDAND